jgi:hypothetical protein
MKFVKMVLLLASDSKEILSSIDMTNVEDGMIHKESILIVMQSNVNHFNNLNQKINNKKQSKLMK